MRANLSLRAIAIATACLASIMACATTPLTTDESSPAAETGDSGPAETTDTGTPKKDSGPAPASDTGTTTDTGTTVVDTGIDTGPLIIDGSVCVRPPPSVVCGDAPQCGCPAGQTCDVTNQVTGAMACITAGAAPMGTACTTTGNCALGLRCWNGTCHAFCNNPSGNCTIPNTTLCFTPDQPAPAPAGTPSVNINLCAVSCDPQNPGVQCGTASCLWFSSAKVSDCRPVATGVLDSACLTLDACVAGLQCSPTISKCEKWCRMGVAADCVAPRTCVNSYGATAPVIGGKILGSCE